MEPDVQADVMSQYELLSLLISILAAVISTVALVRGQRLAKRQLQLQEQQARLAALQHKALTEDQGNRRRADLRAAFEKRERGYKFVLRNAGAAPARNIRLAGPNGEQEPEPLIPSEARSLFPVNELRPGEEVRAIAAIHLGSVLPAPLIFTWDDDSGANQQREIKVQIEG